MYRRHSTASPYRPNSLRPTPVPDWSKLSRGDLVQVHRRDGTSASGRIEMLALDRSIFWIIQDGGRGRIMICKGDGPQVTVVNALETAE